jgi:hypothetical protein
MRRGAIHSSPDDLRSDLVADAVRVRKFRRSSSKERPRCIAEKEFAVLRFTDPSLHALIRADEYEDWPRGRIMFDQSKDRFVLYADRKLMLPGTIARIQKRFSISAGQRRWRPTFAAKAVSVHENSRAMLSPRGLLSSAIPHL